MRITSFKSRHAANGAKERYGVSAKQRISVEKGLSPPFSGPRCSLSGGH